MEINQENLNIEFQKFEQEQENFEQAEQKEQQEKSQEKIYGNDALQNYLKKIVNSAHTILFKFSKRYVEDTTINELNNLGVQLINEKFLPKFLGLAQKFDITAAYITTLIFAFVKSKKENPEILVEVKEEKNENN